jgi:hypothetical protein
MERCWVFNIFTEEESLGRSKALMKSGQIVKTFVIGLADTDMSA